MRRHIFRNGVGLKIFFNSCTNMCKYCASREMIANTAKNDRKIGFFLGHKTLINFLILICIELAILPFDSWHFSANLKKKFALRPSGAEIFFFF